MWEGGWSQQLQGPGTTLQAPKRPHETISWGGSRNFPPLPHCPTGIAGNGCIRDAGQALLRTDSVTHSSKPTGSLHKRMGGTGRTAHTSGCTPRGPPQP